MHFYPQSLSISRLVASTGRLVQNCLLLAGIRGHSCLTIVLLLECQLPCFWVFWWGEAGTSSEQESSAASSEPSRCAATAAMILLFEVAGLERGGFRDITFEVQLCAALYEFQLWCCITVAFVDQPFCRKVVNPVPEVGTLEAQHFGKIARWLHGIT